MGESHLGLVDVRFVGGPLHGTRVFMESPAFKMTFEPAPGRSVEYCRRMVEASHDERAGKIDIATYAPTGVSESDFARFVLAAAGMRWPTAPGE